MAKQSNKKFVVYVCDDYSPEDPRELINAYSNRLNLIYFRFNENLGGKNLVAHWKRSINKIQDEKWIMMLCDDDVLGPNCIEEFYNNLSLLENQQINLFRFSTFVVDQFGNNISNIFKHPKIEKSTKSIIRKIKHETRSSLSEYIFRREAYNYCGFRELPLGWSSDNLLWLELTDYGDILSSNKAHVYFRMSNHNISRPDYETKLKSKVKLDFYSVLVFSYLKKFDSSEQALLISRHLDSMLGQGKLNLKFLILYFRFWMEFRHEATQIKFFRKVFRKYTSRINFSSKTVN